MIGIMKTFCANAPYRDQIKTLCPWDFPAFSSPAPSSWVCRRARAAPSGPNQLAQTGCKIDLTAHEREFGGAEGRLQGGLRCGNTKFCIFKDITMFA